MLIQQYQNMVEELYCDPKEEVIMACFLKSVTTNDLNDNLSQPKKTKNSKKKKNKKKKSNNRNETKARKCCLQEYKNIRIFLLKVLTKFKNFFGDTLLT